MFHLPLSALTSVAHVRESAFRGGEKEGRRYWAVDVRDFVEVEISAEPAAEQRDEVGGGKDGRLEVWGLTGWYLSLLMRVLGVYR